MSNLVHFFFNLQLNMKLYHWNTTSYARHKGSDEFIEKLLDNIDTFMEVYIGKYGRFSMSKKDSQIALVAHDDKSIIELIDQSIKFLTVDLHKILKKEDVDLFNLRDELVGHLNQTKYLFTLS